MKIEVNSLEDIKNAIQQLAEAFNTYTQGEQKEEAQFIDLGLPSGTKWADRNLEGYFTFEDACKMGAPSAVQMAELYEECEWKWDKEKKGYLVTGPNGNSIFLPAAGYVGGGEAEGVGTEGNYWTKCPSKTSATNGRSLYFSSGGVGPLNNFSRAYGFSVRPVQE